MTCTYYAKLGKPDNYGYGNSLITHHDDCIYVKTEAYFGLETPLDKVDISSIQNRTPIFLQDVNWLGYEDSIFSTKDYDFKSIKRHTFEGSQQDYDLLHNVPFTWKADFFFNKKQKQHYIVHLCRALCTDQENYVRDYFSGLRDKKQRVLFELPFPTINKATIPTDRVEDVDWEQSQALRIEYAIGDGSNFPLSPSSEVSELQKLNFKCLGTKELLNLKVAEGKTISLSLEDFRELSEEELKLGRCVNRFISGWVMKRECCYYTDLSSAINLLSGKLDLTQVPKQNTLKINQYRYIPHFGSYITRDKGELYIDSVVNEDSDPNFISAVVANGECVILASPESDDDNFNRSKLSYSLNKVHPEILKFVNQAQNLTKGQGYDSQHILGFEGLKNYENEALAPRFWFDPVEFCYEGFRELDEKKLGVLLQNNASLELPEVDFETRQKIDLVKSKAVTFKYTVVHPTPELMKTLELSYGLTFKMDWDKLAEIEESLHFNNDYVCDDFTPEYVCAILRFKS